MFIQQPVTVAAISLATNLCLYVSADQISRINEPGGPGLNQTDPVFVSTPNGALVAWEDEIDGRRSIRTRVLDEMGQPTGAPVIVVDSPDGTYPADIMSLTRLNDTSGFLRWEQDQFGDYGTVQYGSCIDLATGEFSGSVREFPSYFSRVVGDTSGNLWEVSTDMLYPLDSSMERIPNQEIVIDDGTTFPITSQIVFTENNVVIAHTGVDQETYELAPELHVIPLNGGERTIHELDPEMTFLQNMAIAKSPSGQILAYWDGNTGSSSSSVRRIQLFDQEGLSTSSAVDFIVPKTMEDLETLTPQALSKGWALFGRERTYPEYEYFVHMFELDVAGTQTGEISSLLIHDRRAYRRVETNEGQTSIAVQLGESDSFIAIARADISNQFDIVAGVFESGFSGTYSANDIAPDVAETDAWGVRAASNKSGESVVLWVERSDVEVGYDYKDAVIVRFDPNGDPLGPQSLVETFSGEDAHVMISDDGIVGVYWASWSSMRVARFMPGSLEPQFFTVDLGSDLPRYTNNIKLAFEADGSFTLAWTTAESLLDAGQFRMQRFDAAGIPLTSDPVSFGDTTPYSGDGWDLAGLWLDGENACAVTLRYVRGTPTEDPRFQARLHRINGSGTAVDSGIILVDETSFFGYLTAAPGADGRFLVLNGNDYVVYEREGQPTAIQGEIDGMPTPTTISAGTNGDWLLTGFRDYHYHDDIRRGFGVTTHLAGDGSILYGPHEYPVYPTTASSASAALVGGARTAFVSAPSGLETGVDVLRVDLDAPTCAPADFDCDGQVNGADLAVLLSAWGTEDADLNGDGVTDGADLAMLLAAWAN